MSSLTFRVDSPNFAMSAARSPMARHEKSAQKLKWKDGLSKATVFENDEIQIANKVLNRKTAPPHLAKFDVTEIQNQLTKTNGTIQKAVFSLH